jgi:hypothetical protein
MSKSTMQLSKLIKIGDNDNINTNEYWCETEEAVLEIKDAPQFSKAIVVTEKGEVIIYIMRSTGWTKL